MMDLRQSDYCAKFVSCDNNGQIVEEVEYRRCVECFGDCNVAEKDCPGTQECLDEFPGIKLMFPDFDDFLTKTIPENVLTKYYELEEVYSKSFGAKVFGCTKGEEFIYEVGGSGGYTAQGFYYDEDGNEIGKYTITDIPVEGSGEPRDLSEYECEILIESESSLSGIEE